MRRFGLIGKTLKHSFSKNYFTKKFKDQHITDCSYELFELQSIDEFPRLIASVPDLAGLNVTIPYKEQVLSFIDELDRPVAEMRACNCILVQQGKLKAYNTDYIGFRDSIRPQLKVQHNKALVLGTGGASKAVVYALKELGLEVLLVSRHPQLGAISYAGLSADILGTHKLVVNTTPLGMYPELDTAPDIPYHLIDHSHFLFDLVYNPAQTRFLQLGAARGAQTANGEEMLVLQAEAAWKIWNQG